MSAFTALAAKATENLSPGQAAGSGTGTGGSGTGSGTTGGSGTGAGSSAAGASGTATLGAGASGTTSAPAQNTANAAPVLGSSSLVSLGAAALAALALW